MSPNGYINLAFHEAKGQVFDGKMPSQAAINEANADDGTLCYIVVARGPLGRAISEAVHKVMDDWDEEIKKAAAV